VVGRILLILVARLVAAAGGITQPIQGLALGAAAPRLVLRLERLRLDLPSEGRVKTDMRIDTTMAD